MRQVILDTETTGLGEGSRILEIGCVEVIERKLTGRHFHQYIHPQREIEEGAQAVHGISLEWLEETNAPTFDKIADEFRAFIAGAELVIHNAPFDVSKMNYEFSLLNLSPTEELCSVLDTLVLARDLFPGGRHSLDALCRRFYIDNSGRELHGALLDAELLAEVYLAMTGGQTDLALSAPVESDQVVHTQHIQAVDFSNLSLPVIAAGIDELAAHRAVLDLLDKKSGQAIWRKE